MVYQPVGGAAVVITIAPLVADPARGDQLVLAGLNGVGVGQNPVTPLPPLLGMGGPGH